MAKRIKMDPLVGPNGEKLQVSWMPGGRVRFTFVKCGPAVVTKIFTSPENGTTNIEINYESER